MSTKNGGGGPPNPKDPQKILIYVMPDKGGQKQPGHKFMAIRRGEKNGKGRYVTGPQIGAFGLTYPTSIAKTRADLARLIGEAILDEAGIP